VVYGSSETKTICASAGRVAGLGLNDPGETPLSGLLNVGCKPGPGILPEVVNPTTTGVKNVLLVYVTTNFGLIE
jgi:hypothetical protein